MSNELKYFYNTLVVLHDELYEGGDRVEVLSAMLLERFNKLNAQEKDLIYLVCSAEISEVLYS